MRERLSLRMRWMRSTTAESFKASTGICQGTNLITRVPRSTFVRSNSRAVRILKPNRAAACSAVSVSSACARLGSYVGRSSLLRKEHTRCFFQVLPVVNPSRFRNTCDDIIRISSSHLLYDIHGILISLMIVFST